MIYYPLLHNKFLQESVSSQEPFLFKKEKLREEPFKKVLHPKRTDAF